MAKKSNTPKGVNKRVWSSHRSAHRARVRAMNEQDLEQTFQKETAKPGEGPAPVAAPVPNGWPDKDGFLVLGGRSRAKQAAQPKKTQPGRAEADKIAQNLALLKSVDITAFNFHAEKHFVWWLTEKLKAAEFAMVSLQWCYSNAAYELNISTETVKRYVVKHTADRAEFESRDGFLLLRERNEDA